MQGHARVRPPSRLQVALGATLIAAVLGGCSAPPRRHHRSADDGWDAASPRPQAPRLPFPKLDALTAGPPVAQLRTVHPIGDLEATIRTNDLGAGYGKRGRAPMPEGAIVVESLSNDVESAPLTHYVMRRREAGYFPEGGDWDYAVVDHEGRVEAEGKLTLCARCHAEAPREHLFEPLGPP